MGLQPSIQESRDSGKYLQKVDKEIMVHTTVSRFDNFEIQSGVYYEEEESRGSKKVWRALALHLTQPPQRMGSTNLWTLHLLRMKQVDIQV